MPLRFLIIPILIVLPLVAFAQTANFPFVDFDDGQYVYENPHVLGGLTAENIRWAFTTTHGGKWMPLTWLSFMLDAEFAGRPSPAPTPATAPDATPFHVTNVVLHILNGLLLFAALRALTGSWWCSGLVAALFAVHPLRAESVAWVTERKDVLAACFGFLTLWAYAFYVRAPGWKRYALVAGCFACGLLAKEMFVTLPFLLLLLDDWPLRRFSPAEKASCPLPTESASSPGPWSLVPGLVLEKLPLLAIAAASSTIGFLAHRAGGAVEALAAIPLSSRLANAVWSYAFYLEKTVWPFRLGAFYPHPGDQLATTTLAASALLLIVISAIALWFVRRAPWIFVGWCWFLGTLVPMIGLVQVGSQGMADRFTYLPQIGLIIALVWTAAAIVGSVRWKRIAFATAAGILLVALTWRTHAQTYFWRSSETLFAHTAKVTECNAWADIKLAAYHRRRKETGLEIESLRRALACDPENYAAHMNLGTAYARRGPSHREDALRHLRAALKHRPASYRPWFNLGLLLASDDSSLPEAEDLLREAIRRRPPSHAEWKANGPIVWTALGRMLARENRLDEARECFAQALALDPGFQAARESSRRIGSEAPPESRSSDPKTDWDR